MNITFENTRNKLDMLKWAIETQMPANKILGLVIEKLREGYVKLRVPFREEFIGDFVQNRWHGGFLASIADTVGGIVAGSVLSSPMDRLNTIDMRIDFLHGTTKKDIYAEGEILKTGKRIIKADVRLWHDETKLVAVARCAYSVLLSNNQ